LRTRSAISRNDEPISAISDQSADGRIDLVIVDDGKAVVGTVWKKGQDMDAADHVLQVFVGEGLQGPKVPAVLGCQGQYRTVVFYSPPIPSSAFCFSDGSAGGLPRRKLSP
jgi:hypothetical protein